MIKDTVAPIPIEELKEYFNDDSIIFNIDYAKSSLKNDKLLTYISNLDVPVRLSGFDELQYEEKEEFILSYLNSKLIVNLEDIEELVLYILLVALGFQNPYKDWEKYAHEIGKASELDNVYITDVNASSELTRGVSLDHDSDGLPNAPIEKQINMRGNFFFKLDELLSFIKNNREVIDRWIISIASGSVYNIAAIKDSDGKSIYNPENEFEILDDYDYVGVNYVKLFAYENTQMILTYEGCPLYYMKKQFEEYMFKGNNIHYYFMHRNNFMAVYTTGIAYGFANGEDFYDAIEKDIENIV